VFIVMARTLMNEQQWQAILTVNLGE